MKLNIRSKILLSFTVSLLLLCAAILTLSLTSIHTDSVTYSTTSAAGQLKHIDGTISMYLQETINNTVMMAEDPRTKRVDEILTNYLDASKDYPTTGTIPEDLLGREIRGLYQMILKSHPSYVDCYIGTNTGAFIIAGDDPLPAGYDPRQRPWYKVAAESPNKGVISEAYVSTTGEAMISTGKAVLDNGRVVGVTAMDLSLSQFTKLLEQVKIGETGYGFISNDQGLIVAHPNQDFVMKLDISEFDFGKTLLREKDGQLQYYFEKQSQWKVMGFHEVEQTGWIVATTAPLDELMVEIREMANYAIIGASVTAILVALVILYFVSKIVKIIVAASTQMMHMARGDTSRDVAPSLLALGDELGDLSRSCQTLIEEERSRAKTADSIAKGDLTVDVQEASEVDTLGLALKDMAAGLNTVMTGVSNASQQVAAGAGEVSSSSQSLSQGATEQAASIEEITSSMAELSSRTRKNAETASEATGLAEAARGAATDGNVKMEHMTQAMNDISESSQAIAKIIKVIDEIAFQTNLLALNAAVEAARAGRHGKGFAVVAEEVRNLAGRSAKAAEETTQLIESSIDRVSVGSTAADDTAAVLARIVDEVSRVADLLAIISKESAEQAEGIGEIGQGLDQIDQVTQQSTANAEETASASEELAAQAETLQKLVQRFQLKQEQGSTRYAVRQAPPQPLPQAASKQPEAPNDSEWGQGPSPAKPEEIISLDDDEFGKY